MNRKPPADALRALARLGIDLPPDRLECLGDYLARLLAVNERTNLTAVRDPDEAWQRLIVDSLTVLPRIGAEAERLIDIGSGGGLPGIPVAIARPDLGVTLVEATGKKCAALAEFAEGLGLERVDVSNARAEDLARDGSFREGYDVATSRAVGALAMVLELSLPFVRVGGRVVAMKGPSVEAEREAALRAAKRVGGDGLTIARSYPEDFENGLVLVEVEKAATTPKAFPRAPGQIKKNPL